MLRNQRMPKKQKVKGRWWDFFFHMICLNIKLYSKYFTMKQIDQCKWDLGIKNRLISTWDSYWIIAFINFMSSQKTSEAMCKKYWIFFFNNSDNRDYSKKEILEKYILIKNLRIQKEYEVNV